MAKLKSTYSKVVFKYKSDKVITLTREATLRIDVSISDSFSDCQKRCVIKQRNSKKYLKNFIHIL